MRGRITWHKGGGMEGSLYFEKTELKLAGTSEAIREWGTWRAREREPMTGVWGQSSQGGPGAEPLIRGSGGAKPPEADAVLALMHP